MEYYSPKKVNELIELVTKHQSEAAIIAGCTDIIVKNNFFENKNVIIDITSVEELKGIQDIGNKTRLGACVTFANLLNSDLIKNQHKALYEAARVYGSVQIRNRGTVAGNIINASPAADSIPPLMVANAELVLVSKSGEEKVNIRDFFVGPGKTTLKPGQILAFIDIEKDTSDTITFYRKIGTRKALSIAKASVAFKATKANGKLSNVSLAYGSVGPTVIYSKEAQKYLEGKDLNNESIDEASRLAFNEVSPIDDIRSTGEYRRLVIKNVVIEELKQYV